MMQSATVVPSSAEREARFEDLVRLLQSIPPSIFDPFEIHRAHYQSSGGPIGADIIIPRNVKSPASLPVIVRIHGGFFVRLTTSCLAKRQLLRWDGIGWDELQRRF